MTPRPRLPEPPRTPTGFLAPTGAPALSQGWAPALSPALSPAPAVRW